MAFSQTPVPAKAGRAFGRTTDGSASVEAILVTPLLLTALMLSYGFFSAFDAKMRATKAAYTLADYVTRQTTAVTPEFVAGMAEMSKFLNNQGDISLRVSAVRWSTATNDEGAYELVWSSGTGALAALDSLSTIEARLPLLSEGSEVVVVESIRPWSAPFGMGLDDVQFTDIVTTQPRFSTQVMFDDGTDTGSGGSGPVVGDVEGDGGSIGHGG
ncbi:TadE/TadG family type IV pilus assembly protein [Celeribacter sp.]|uniref:TadE/TadG family type IV pilus assembly protein n=1 Tax=Celeribacter sp. TaxID=1890673 RepID=UPI003A91BB7B